MIAGHAVTLWIAIGGLTVDKPKSKILDLHTDGCGNTSFNAHILKPEHRVLSWTPSTTPTPIDEEYHTTRAVST